MVDYFRREYTAGNKQAINRIQGILISIVLGPLNGYYGQLTIQLYLFSKTGVNYSRKVPDYSRYILKKLS